MRSTSNEPEIQETVSLIQKLCACDDIPNLHNYLENIDVQVPENQETLRQIAMEIQCMDAAEMHTFASALDAEAVNTLEDILRISQSLADYAFFPNIASDEELGKFLVCAGYRDIPNEVLPYLDYAKLGAEYYAEYSGAYGPDGYVQRTEQKKHKPFKAIVISPNISAPKAIYLPAAKDQIERLMLQMSVSDIRDIQVIELKKLEPEAQALYEMLNLDGATFPQVNSLANKTERLMQKDGEYLKFLSALTAEQIHTCDGALEIADQLDRYTRILEDAEEYGKDALRRMGAPEAVIDTIEGYMDIEGFGRVMMTEDGVELTEFGMIRKDTGQFPPPRRSMQMESML